MAYSLDLRERIVEAVKEGCSQRAAAERFKVSLSNVERYLRNLSSGFRSVPGAEIASVVDE